MRERGNFALNPLCERGNPVLFPSPDVSAKQITAHGSPISHGPHSCLFPEPVSMKVSSYLRNPAVKAGRFRNPFRKNRQGVAAVEMALILPVLLIVLFGTINCSELMHFRKSMVVAASDGIRLASQRESTSAEALARTNAVLASRRVSNPTITLQPANVELAAPGDVIQMQITADFGGFGLASLGWDSSFPVTVSTSILRE